jgi:hypothetical protein
MTVHYSSGLYYKHVTILNYTSSGINKLKDSLNDDTRVVIYYCHVFIVQATGADVKVHWYLSGFPQAMLFLFRLQTTA